MQFEKEQNVAAAETNKAAQVRSVISTISSKLGQQADAFSPRSDMEHLRVTGKARYDTHSKMDSATNASAFSKFETM